MYEDAMKRGRWVGDEPWKRYGEVTLHIYHFGQVAKLARLPVYHLGVEVYECEHSFGATGVEWCWPMQYDAPRHKKAIVLGKTKLDALEVWKLIDELMPDWEGSSYHFWHRNCQTFAAALIPRLVPGATVPSQYCRFK